MIKHCVLPEEFKKGFQKELTFWLNVEGWLGRDQNRQNDRHIYSILNATALVQNLIMHYSNPSSNNLPTALSSFLSSLQPSIHYQNDYQEKRIKRWQEGGNINLTRLYSFLKSFSDTSKGWIWTPLTAYLYPHFYAQPHLQTVPNPNFLNHIYSSRLFHGLFLLQDHMLFQVFPIHSKLT